jgi:hypothetical protein
MLAFIRKGEIRMHAHFVKRNKGRVSQKLIKLISYELVQGRTHTRRSSFLSVVFFYKLDI